VKLLQQINVIKLSPAFIRVNAMSKPNVSETSPTSTLMMETELVSKTLASDLALTLLNAEESFTRKVNVLHVIACS
jgi:hypothetical protein